MPQDLREKRSGDESLKVRRTCRSCGFRKYPPAVAFVQWRI
jgi:hypothetical protein